MARDDFSTLTKRNLAHRAGGRCSFPGCDVLCWLPGSEPYKTATIGVAAHIKAASPEGPRYDKDQNEEERKDISNGIYMCQIHAHLIGTDEIKYKSENLLEWKQKHENQIRNEADASSYKPKFELIRNLGISVSGEFSGTITSETIGNRIEHELLLTNTSDFEYARFGFNIQFPEMIEHKPIVKAPPGFSYEIIGENMDWQVHTSGGGSVNMSPVKSYGSFVFEGSGLLQGQSVRITIKSVPDPHFREKTDDRIYYHICGETNIKIGSLLTKRLWILPLIYENRERNIVVGNIHEHDPNNDVYVSMRRC